MKNVAIIMAGGRGERFWPLSTKNYPKQFLKLTNSSLTMIQLTVERIKSIVDYDDIFVVTNEAYKDAIDEQLSMIKKENIIYEPISKNTAPCLGLATAIIKKKYGDANVIILSSDHLISNNILFLSNIEIALKYSEQNHIITLGIVPNRIETGYGYIRLGKRVEGFDSIYKITSFVEKPSFEKAKEYYESKEYLWNSGMFVWKNSYIYELFKEYMSDLFNSITKIEEVIGTPDYAKVLNEEYQKVESQSIDYGIMEKAKDILVIPGNFGWDDVGSFLSVERIKDLDENNNILDGNIVNLDCNNCTIFNNVENNLIATYGLEGLVVVNTNKSLLIISKDKVPDVKKLIEKIKQSGKYNDYL